MTFYTLEMGMHTHKQFTSFPKAYCITMERLEYRPALQGGGTGSGFILTHYILYDEPIRFKLIYVYLSSRASAMSKQHKGISGELNTEVGEEALNRRLFLLEKKKICPCQLI